MKQVRNDTHTCSQKFLSVSSVCKKTPICFVVLIFASVVYFSKLLISKNIKRLIFGNFLIKHSPNFVFGQTLSKIILTTILFLCGTTTTLKAQVIIGIGMQQNNTLDCSLHTLQGSWISKPNNTLITNSNTQTGDCVPKVGIGIDTPLAMLHVKDNGIIGGRLNIGAGAQYQGVLSVSRKINFNNYPNQAIIYAGVTNGTVSRPILTVDLNGTMTLYKDETPLFKVSAQTETVYSKEIIVRPTNWPDYVFEKSYELKPLQEIEEFINTNSHLPNIPSAKEVEENGIQVGEMNQLMLEKIEELTLYLILQEKEIEQLKLRISELEEAE